MFKVSAWWYHNWSLLSVLDSSTGKPAEGVEVVLQVFHQVGKASVFEPIAEKYVHSVYADVTVLLTLILHQSYRLRRSLYATLPRGWARAKERGSNQTASRKTLQGCVQDQGLLWECRTEVLLPMGRGMQQMSIRPITLVHMLLPDYVRSSKPNRTLPYTSAYQSLFVYHISWKLKQGEAKGWSISTTNWMVISVRVQPCTVFYLWTGNKMRTCDDQCTVAATSDTDTGVPNIHMRAGKRATRRG